MWGGNKDYLVDTTLHEEEAVGIAVQNARAAKAAHLAKMQAVDDQEAAERAERIRQAASMWGGNNKGILTSTGLVILTFIVGVLPR